MKNTYKLLMSVIICSYLIFLISCQESGNSTGVPKISSPAMSIASLRALPTPLTVFEYTDQVTDGQILFSIATDAKVCHKINQSFKIKLIFMNMLNKTIKLPDDFSIASNRLGDGGNINPFITTTDGNDIFS